MRTGNKLAHNTLVYSIGGLSPKILSYALLPLYTSFLSPSDYGHFDVLMVTVSLLVPFVSVDMPSAVYRFSITEHQKIRSEIFSTAAGLIFRNLLYFNCLAILAISVFHYQYLWLFLVLANISVVAGLLMETLRSTGQLLFFSGLQLISAIVMLALNILLIVFVGLKVEALVISNIAGLVISSLIGAYHLKVRDMFSISAISKPLRNSMVNYSRPLVLSTVCWWVMMSSDRYIISYFCGLDATGIYSIANKLPSLLMILYLNFGFSWQDTAISVYHTREDHDFYTRTFDKLMTIVLSGGLVFIASSKFILGILVNDKFHEAWLYVPLLFLGSVFYILSSFYSVGFQCAKKTMGSFHSSVIGAGANILGNLLFVPVWGMQGAALATCLSFFIMWVLRVYLLKDILKIKINRKKLLSLLILMGITIILYYQLNIYYHQLLLLFGTTMIFAAYNRSLINMFLRKLPKISAAILAKTFGTGQ